MYFIFLFFHETIDSFRRKLKITAPLAAIVFCFYTVFYELIFPIYIVTLPRADLSKTFPIKTLYTAYVKYYIVCSCCTNDFANDWFRTPRNRLYIKNEKKKRSRLHKLLKDSWYNNIQELSKIMPLSSITIQTNLESYLYIVKH